MFHPAAYQPMGGCGTGQLKEEGWFWRLPGPEELKSIDEELKRAGCLNKDTQRGDAHCPCSLGHVLRMILIGCEVDLTNMKWIRTKRKAWCKVLGSVTPCRPIGSQLWWWWLTYICLNLFKVQTSTHSQMLDYYGLVLVQSLDNDLWHDWTQDFYYRVTNNQSHIMCIHRFVLFKINL